MKIAYNLTLTFFLLLTSNLSAQGSAIDTLYIKYEKKIRLKESVDSINNITLELSFTLNSKDDIKATTYNFKIDNIAFPKDLKFNEIRDTIPKNKLEEIKYFTLNDLKEFSACELYFLLGDTKNIYLIKEDGDIYYKYKLNYWSTQRGWEFLNMN